MQALPEVAGVSSYKVVHIYVTSKGDTLIAVSVLENPDAWVAVSSIENLCLDSGFIQ